MQFASIWLIFPLFALAYVCFKTAWQIWKSDERHEPQLFIGTNAVRKAARKARRLSL